MCVRHGDELVNIIFHDTNIIPTYYCYILEVQNLYSTYFYNEFSDPVFQHFYFL